MTKQIRHTRTSKKGKKFPAGRKKRVQKSNVLAEPGDAVLLKRYIKFMSNVANEANFMIMKSGIKTMVMDPANVVLFTINIKPGRAVGKIPVKTPKKLGLNLQMLNNIFKDIKAKEQLRLLLDSPGNKLRIKNITRKSTHEIPLITIESEVKVPNLTPNYEFEVSGDDLLRALKEAEKASESVTIWGKKDGPSLMAESDLSQFKTDLGTKISGDELQIAKYSIEYLKTLYPILPLYNHIYVSFSKDYPIRLLLKNSIADVAYILAPRVEN